MKASLYVHIPFCRTKCDYCDFFSVACGRNSVPDEYIVAITNEIALRCQRCSVDSFSTVYIGGGTPSLLTFEQIKKLCSAINSLSKIPVEEFTVEANPDDITESLLKVFAENGITRLSCGIQAFEQKVLQGVKRRSTSEKVISSLELIKKYWKGVFSADIIAALPGQSESTFLEGLRKLVEYGVDHISMYSLTIEEETPLGKSFASGLLEYDFDFADKIWLSGRNFLESNGYPQYEVSNFASENFQCRHNLAYWQQMDYLGCGAGGTGTIYKKNERDSKDGIRFTNSTDIKKYIEFWGRDVSVLKKEFENAPGICESISKKTQEFEFFMMGLRTIQGISLAEYENRFLSEIPLEILQVMKNWQNKNLADFYKKNGENWFTLGKRGIIYLNDFLREII